MGLRIDACTARLLAATDQDDSDLVEWYRENGDAVSIRIAGATLHTSINGIAQEPLEADSPEHARASVRHLVNSDTIR